MAVQELPDLPVRLGGPDPADRLGSHRPPPAGPVWRSRLRVGLGTDLAGRRPVVEVVLPNPAVASALGYIGDRRTIGPLLDMLFDESLTDLSRAFAAVALGGVIDKEPLTWNSKIGVNMNYRAMVETLTDGAAGILDIL